MSATADGIRFLLLQFDLRAREVGYSGLRLDSILYSRWLLVLASESDGDGLEVTLIKTFDSVSKFLSK